MNITTGHNPIAAKRSAVQLIKIKDVFDINIYIYFFFLLVYILFGNSPWTIVQI